MLRMEKRFDLSQPANAIKVLDAYIQSLNFYLKNNKNKIKKNESDRSADIETIATRVYDCFEAPIGDKIDEVLSGENLDKPISKELPLPSSLNLAITNEADFIKRYFNAMANIKSHKFKTGLYGNSKLKKGIEDAFENLINNEVLLQCATYADVDAQTQLKSISKFFNPTVQQETYILFYTDKPNNQNIYFVYPSLLDRLSVCFKTKDFIEGKVAIDIKRDRYGVVVERSRSAAMALLNKKEGEEVGRICFGLQLTSPREKIRKLREEKQFLSILESISSLDAWENNVNGINQLACFSLNYDRSASKFDVKEVPKSSIINK